MIPAKTSLYVTEGNTWSQYFNFYEDDGLTPVVTTGYTAVLTLKSSSVTGSIILTASTAGSYLTNNDAGFDLLVPNTVTSTFTFTDAVFDLTLTSPAGVVNTYLYGDVLLHEL